MTSQDRGASQLVGRTKFVGADDCIILEDESARMKLRGEGLPVGQLVTGVVMVVKGFVAPGGDFHVNVGFQSACQFAAQTTDFAEYCLHTSNTCATN